MCVQIIQLFVTINKSGININVDECLAYIKSNNSRFDWNPSSYKCEYKKKTALLTEECEEIIDNKTWLIKKHIKTVSIKKTFQ